MNLYRARAGVSPGWLYCLVVAETDDRALELARGAFTDDRRAARLFGAGWEKRVEVELLGSCDQELCTEIEE